MSRPPLPAHVQHGMQQRVVMTWSAIARLYILRGTFIVDMLSTVAWFAQVRVQACQHCVNDTA